MQARARDLLSSLKFACGCCQAIQPMSVHSAARPRPQPFSLIHCSFSKGDEIWNENMHDKSTSVQKMEIQFKTNGVVVSINSY